ncbi:MAG TPA: DUF1223 domain-containing protein [Vicinamibacterales bacterium]|nr:DUF1223 domain-containing protein [Vicinamibacterales bacterium]
MKTLTRIGMLAAVVACASAAMVARDWTQPTAPLAPRAVVLAELFTSEGCSSCPPADTLLRRLVADQPIDGVEIVALGSHVDYWDRLGWRDPFSSPVFSGRQETYSASVFRLNSTYTPQLVVDGTLESVGSDEAAVWRNIRKAAAQPKAAVQITATPAEQSTIELAVHVDVGDRVQRTGPAEILVAVTEDGLESRVQRGENGGRTLLHSAVVRVLKSAAPLRLEDQTASTTVTVPLGHDWRLPHLRFVAFVQEQISRRVLGAAATMVAHAAE